MIRPARLAAMLAPVLGLAALWAHSDHTYRQGTEWDVPIAGYDPRDYLRGHYVEFAYDWPGMAEAAPPPPGADLCLSGTAPVIAQTAVIDAAAPCAHRLRAPLTDVYGPQGLVRGRLYVGQERARLLETQLLGRDQRAIVTIRQREDGSFTPVAIRFRPLTAAEAAERDAQRQRTEDTRPPPAIMSQ